jgi:DNA-binding MarR family transcriptional regulator
MAASRPRDAGETLERLFTLSTVLTDAMDAGLAERGLTRARAGLIWSLRHGEPMTQRDLAEALQCTPRNVTDLVDALESAGLVSRAPHPTDRRATLVSLTRKGKAAAKTMQGEYGSFAATLFAGLSERERALFSRVVDKLGAGLVARGKR